MAGISFRGGMWISICKLYGKQFEHHLGSSNSPASTFIAVLQFKQ